MSINSIPNRQEEPKTDQTAPEVEPVEDDPFAIHGSLMVDTGANISTERVTSSMIFHLGSAFFWKKNAEISPGFYVGARYHLIPERQHRVERLGLTANPALVIRLARATIIAEGGVRPQYNRTNGAFDLAGGGSINFAFDGWGAGIFAEQHDILTDKMNDGVSFGLRLFTHFRLN